MPETFTEQDFQTGNRTFTEDDFKPAGKSFSELDFMTKEQLQSEKAKLATEPEAGRAAAALEDYLVRPLANVPANFMNAVRYPLSKVGFAPEKPYAAGESMIPGTVTQFPAALKSPKLSERLLGAVPFGLVGTAAAFFPNTKVGKAAQGIAQSIAGGVEGSATPENVLALGAGAGAGGESAAAKALTGTFAATMGSQVPGAVAQTAETVLDPKVDIADKAKSITDTLTLIGFTGLLGLHLKKLGIEKPALTPEDVAALDPPSQRVLLREALIDLHDAGKGDSPESIALHRILERPDVEGARQAPIIGQESADVPQTSGPGTVIEPGRRYNIPINPQIVAPGGVIATPAERPGGGPALFGKTSYAAEAPTLTSNVPDRTAEAMAQETFAAQALQDVRPGILTMEGEKAVGKRGQTHDQIIADNKFQAGDIDRRTFYDAQGNEIGRQALAPAVEAAGVEPSVPATETTPAEAHAPDLARVQEAAAAPSAEQIRKDIADYETLSKRYREIGLSHPDTSEVWKARENIKNKYGGMEPTEAMAKAVEGEKIVPAAEAAPATKSAPISSKLVEPVAQKAETKSADTEFKRLVEEYGEQHGWILRPDAILSEGERTAKGQQGTIGIKASIASSQELGKAYKRAMAAMGDTSGVNSAAKRAAALPKLKQFLEERAAEAEAESTAEPQTWTSTEFLPPEGPAPKLAPGVKQGDLISSTQQEPFALVGEKGTDAERVAAAKAKAEQTRQEAAGIAAKQQQTFAGLQSTIIPGLDPASLRAIVKTATPAVNAASDALAKTRRTVSTEMKTRPFRAEMAWTLDRADNAARLFARGVANDIRGPLRRLMGRGKVNPLDEQALSFVREADGDPAALAAARRKVVESTKASPKWKAAALRAIDHGIQNWDRINQIASDYQGITDRQVEMENGAGINTVKRSAYVPHVQDLPDEFGFMEGGGGTGGAGFKHMRTHATLADSIAAGVDPKSLNAVDLLEQRIAAGQRLINRRAWLEGLRDTTDPKTGKPIVTSPISVPRGEGLPPDFQYPSGYQSGQFAGRPVAVLKPYAGVFEAITEPSKLSGAWPSRVLLKAVSTGKSIALAVDTFHLGRVAFWESIIKPLSFTDPKFPQPSFKRGVLTMDYSAAELTRMAEAGEIPTESLQDVLATRERVQGLVQAGYNIGRISDNLHQEWIRRIPGLGTSNRFIFDQFQRGAMAEIGALEVGRYQRMHPDWTPERVNREVAKDLNTRFGNLGRQGILKSKTYQDMARIVFLAPQWNEGLLRSEVGAVTGTVRGVKESIQGRRLAFGVLPRAVGAMMLGQFAANQLINYITRGKPTWENEEEGFGAKISAWIPDAVGGGPGFFLHPFGLAAEVTHLVTTKYEKTEDLRKSLLAFLGSRLSTAARPLAVAISGRDPMGRLLRPDEVLKQSAIQAIPTPIGASAPALALKGAIAGEKTEKFPGQYQKQMMASVGIKTDQAPSDERRIRSLATKFKKDKGIVPQAEFFEGPYIPLVDAVQRGNTKDAQKALADLQKQKTLVDVVKYMRERANHPFAGSRKRELEFLSTLSLEQLHTYGRTLEHRKEEFRKFMELLRK